MVNVKITPDTWLTKWQQEELQECIIGMTADGEWDGECWQLVCEEEELDLFKDLIDLDWVDIEVYDYDEKEMI